MFVLEPDRSGSSSLLHAGIVTGFFIKKNSARISSRKTPPSRRISELLPEVTITFSLKQWKEWSSRQILLHHRSPCLPRKSAGTADWLMPTLWSNSTRKPDRSLKGFIWDRLNEGERQVCSSPAAIWRAPDRVKLERFQCRGSTKGGH